MKTSQQTTVIKLFRVIFTFTLLLTFNHLQAQDDENFTDFLYSGTVTGAGTVRVPIEIFNDEILIKVKVNGNTATFMWDNGCSTSCIDNSLVQRFGFLPYNGSVGGAASLSVLDANAVTINANALVCPKLVIDGIIISDTPFLGIDTRVFTMTKKIKIEGVIGASVINKLNWKFNFDENYVEISMKPFALHGTKVILPFNIINNNLHYMPISFNGHNTDCQIDFGYNGNQIEVYVANAHLFAKSSATKTIGPNAIGMAGVGAMDTIYTIKDNFTWELTGKKLDIKPKVSFTKTTGSVVIGNKLFRDNYNVTINTLDSAVYALSPRSKPEALKSDKTYGYKLHIVDGVFKVMSIDANSNTVNGGVKLLDEVTSINGMLPEDFEDNYSLRAYQKELLEKQKKMVLKLKNGKEITLMPQPGIEYVFNPEKGIW